LADLAAEVTDSPAIWNNLALVRSWLADNTGARDAFRKYASLDVPLQDAVESEAIAMLIDDSPLGDDVDIVRWTWSVSDAERLQELLLSDRHIKPIAVDASQWPVNDSPPPRMAGILLDRPAPDTDASFSLENMPSILGQLLLFGRETDRAARLELSGLTKTQADSAKAILRKVGGDTLEAEPDEALLGRTSASHQLISRRWVPPRGAPRAQVDALLVQDFRESLLNRWPDQPLGVLGGQSLRQAASDPVSRVKALAVILVMQQWAGRSVAEFDFNELRSQLGLPTLDPIELQPGEVQTIPLVRLVQARVEKLSDDDLVLAFHRAALYHAWDATRKFARAIIDRPVFVRRPERTEAYRALAQSATTIEEGIATLDEARRAALSNGESCAVWDLMELSFRFGHGNGEHAIRLIQHIESQHMQEQGVAQALTQMLINVGILNPDGTPVGMPDPGTAAEFAPPASEPSKLWTPGSESSGSGGKLWTPA
jgi:hypothetical protein